MTTTRITNTLNELAKEGRKALVSFIMAGDPSADASVVFARQLINGGTDILEIGMPFSDPSADGVAIQLAGQRALEAHTDLQSILDIIATIRITHKATPIILMGYYNNVYHIGEEQFVTRAASAGVDGIILVDLPYEMATSMRTVTTQHAISLIPLVAPNTPTERMQRTLAEATGFIYAIAIKGITGTKTPEQQQVNTQVSKIRAVSRLPVVLGFGIRHPEQARKLSQLVDGVVIGSAYCDLIASHLDNTAVAATVLNEKARAIKNAIT